MAEEDEAAINESKHYKHSKTRSRQKSDDDFDNILSSSQRRKSNKTLEWDSSANNFRKKQ